MVMDGIEGFERIDSTDCKPDPRLKLIKVVNDKSGGTLIGNILDASEIYHY